jgi:DNA-binding response OmpR family regulator
VLRYEVAMAQMGRASLRVCICDEDDGHRMRLVDAFARGGCTVRVVDTPMLMMAEAPPPELVVVDATAPGAESVIRWARAGDLHCFALLPKDARVDDDKLMRMGASLVVAKPVDPDALLIQARFLARAG